MSDQQAFDKLKDFFENRAVCAKAADPLSRDVEIGFVISRKVTAAFFKDGGKPRFEMRPAKNPDVIFHISPEAVDRLVNDPSEEIADLGINIAKSYLAGLVKIKVPGSVMALLTRGYIGVIRAGGLSFGKFMAGHGITGLSKIKELIQKLR